MRTLYLFLLLLAQASPVFAIQWHEPWNVIANGQKLVVETFSSRLPVDVVARRLAHQNAAFDRYLVGDGRLFLSGVRSGVHWLAEMYSRSERTHGYVSALYFDPARHVDAVANSAMADRPLGRSALRMFEFDGEVRVGMFKTADPSINTWNSSGATSGGFEFFTSGRRADLALAVALPEQ